MTVKGGTTPACAACKYQRRKCSPNCLLAPYFPSNMPKMFQNVHRLFGVSNVTKVLMSLKTKVQRDDAMKSIIYESDMRAIDPVYGCTGLISQLMRVVKLTKKELDDVLLQLQLHRASAGGGSTLSEYPSGGGLTLSEYPSTSNNADMNANQYKNPPDMFMANEESPMSDCCYVQSLKSWTDHLELVQDKMDILSFLK